MKNRVGLSRSAILSALALGIIAIYYGRGIRLCSRTDTTATKPTCSYHSTDYKRANARHSLLGTSIVGILLKIISK